MALSKAKDFESLSDEDLAEQIAEVRKDLFQLRFQKATRQTVKPHQFKHARHRLAQLMTIERQRQSVSASAQEE
jgi:large subunit ribosomal protein L29